MASPAVKIVAVQKVTKVTEKASDVEEEVKVYVVQRFLKNVAASYKDDIKPIREESDLLELMEEMWNEAQADTATHFELQQFAANFKLGGGVKTRSRSVASSPEPEDEEDVSSGSKLRTPASKSAPKSTPKSPSASGTSRASSVTSGSVSTAKVEFTFDSSTWDDDRVSKINDIISEFKLSISKGMTLRDFQNVFKQHPNAEGAKKNVYGIPAREIKAIKDVLKEFNGSSAKKEDCWKAICVYLNSED